MTKELIEFYILDKVNKDMGRYKSRHPDMTKELEQMLFKEMMRIQTDLAVIREKEEKSRIHQRHLKNIENIEKKGSNFAKKQQKTRDFLSKNENKLRYTVNDEKIVQNTLKQDISDLETRQQYYLKSLWKSLSEKVRKDNLKLNNGLCELCGKNKATEVHHLVKFYNLDSEELRNELLLDEENVICLCSECHHNIHSKRGLLDVQQKRVIDLKRLSINQKYFNKGKLLNMSDICFLDY